MSQYIFILVWIAAMFFLKSVMSGGYRVENILGKKAVSYTHLTLPTNSRV